jgi:5-methylcytosine-specific restriction endonuclease McrA
MKTGTRHDKALLLKTARAVVEELWHRTEGTSLSLRWPSRVGKVNTGGWRAKIGNLGKGQPSLQVWLDHFSGYDARKFNFCFYSDDRAKMRRLAARASKQLPIHRRITEKDLERDGFYFLSERLRRNEFGSAILEEYWGKLCYYGIYDLTVRSASTEVNPKLCARAASFFESVARTMPNAKPENEEREVYPHIENRKLVTSHLRRERSSYLATERKIHDNYECQVCFLRFEDDYGKLGEGFAEAHHRIPLHRLSGKVRTCKEDLATVCANCHRMLHKMEGKRNDVEELRAIVRKHKRRRK